MLCIVMLYPMVLYGTVSFFPSYVYKNGEQSPHPSCINLPWSICGTCALRAAKGPTFHIEDRPNNLGSTWGSSPNEPGHWGPIPMPIYSPSLDIFSAAKMKECHMVNSWLVVSTPLKNISQLGVLFPIYGKIKNVPNHQPDRC